MGKEILEGCKILLHTCGAVKENEKVLVVTDETSRQIGEAMYQCAVEYTDATLICTKDRTTHGEAPTDCVAAAMAQADVIFQRRLSHCTTQTRESKPVKKEPVL